MAGKNHANRQRRVLTKTTQVTRREPEDIVILDIDLDHAAYGPGEIKAVMDGRTFQHIASYQEALHIARDVPIFEKWSDLEDDDPYVRFYTDKLLRKVDTDKVRAMMQLDQKEQFDLIQKAKRRAGQAYKSVTDRIASDALQLGLLYYLDFTGPVPDIEIDSTDRDGLFSLPPLPERDMSEGFEQRLNFILELSLTDPKFRPALQFAMAEAMKKAREDGIIGTSGLAAPEVTTEEPQSEEGFQANNAD